MIEIHYSDPPAFEERLQRFLTRQRANDQRAPVDLPALRDAFERCVRRLVEHDSPAIVASGAESRVVRALIDLVQGGDAGSSPRLLFKLVSYNAEQIVDTSVVAHFAPVDLIRDQVRRWKAYCKPIRDYSARLEGTAEEGGYGVVAWTFLRRSDAPNRPLATLLDQLRDPDAIRRNRAVHRAAIAVRLLFRDSLSGRAPRGTDAGPISTGWHYDSKECPASPPLHFYNTLLPPLLTLRDTRWSATNTEAAQPLVFKPIAESDDQVSALAPGARVAIPYGPDSVAVVADPQRQGRVVLLPGDYNPRDERLLRRSPRPILARILCDVIPDPIPPAGFLIGTVQTTRPELFRQALARVRDQLPPRQHQGLRRDDQVFFDPIGSYSALLAQPTLLHSSIIHGDLNLGNVLVDASADEDQPQPLLIDFEWTEAGGHTAFDLVKLEVEYRRKVLAGAVERVEQLLLLETALFHALLPESPTLHRLLAAVQLDAALADAYTFITAVREIALELALTMHEYYLGLVAYAIATLKWEVSFSAPEQAPGQSLGLSPAVAAYACAACASDVARWVKDLPPPPQLPVLLPNRAEEDLLLIGRRDLITQISQHLTTSNRPVACLRSVALNGLEAVGGAISAGLKAQGVRLAGTAERLPTSVLTLLKAVVDQLSAALREPLLRELQPHLSRAAFRDLAAVAPTAAFPDLPRGAGRYRADEVCRALVQTLEQTGQRWLLTIHNGAAPEELRLLVARLRIAARPQVALLILDDPAPPSTAAHSERLGRDDTLPLWTETEIAIYLARRGLSPQLAERLLTAGQQLPELIHRLGQDLAELSLSESDRRLDRLQAQQIDAIFQEQMHGIDPQLRRLLAFEGLLVEHIRPLDPSAEARQAGAHPYRRLVEHYAWDVTVKIDQETLAAYDRLVSRNTPGITRALQRKAFAELRQDGRQLAAISGWLARHFLNSPDPRLRDDSLMIAQLWVLADERDQALAALYAQRFDPEEHFSTTACLRLGDLFEALTQQHDTALPEILDIAGSYEQHVGNLSKAASYYEQGIFGQRSDLLASQLSQLKLWRIYDAFEHEHKYQQLVDLCEGLLADDIGEGPLRLILAGLHIYGQFMLNPKAMEHASEQLSAVIAELERELARWPDADLQRPTIVRQFLLLQDLAAKILFIRDDFIGARRTLMRLWEQIDPQGGAWSATVPRTLIARTFSNLGLVFLTDPARPKDLQNARVYLEKALQIRDALGDHFGQLRTAINLVIHKLYLAHNRREWQEAAAFFDRYLPLAQVDQETAETIRLKGNYVEFLIWQGDFSKARHIQFNLDLHSRSPGYRFVYTTRARLEIWDRQLEEASELILAHHHLFQPAQAQADDEDIADDGDVCGWLQSCYELIWIARLSDPRWRPAPRIQHIITHSVLPPRSPDQQGPIIQAEWDCADGLRELALGLIETAAPRRRFEAAVAPLQAARASWKAYGYHYVAALAGLWQLAGLRWSGQSAAADRLAAILQREIVVFGEHTTAYQLLQRTLGSPI